MPGIVSVTLPELGESVTEGSIVEWRVRAGDWIESGEPLVDITTDKVDVEVPATATGIVTSVAAAAGETVDVGALLAQIDTSQTKPADGAASAAPESADHPTPPASAVATVSAPATAVAPAAPVAVSPSTTKNGNGNGASYRAHRFAERSHVTLDGIAGSGPGGMVLVDDVRSSLRNGNVAAVSPATRAPAAAATALKSSEPALPRDAIATPIKGPANALVGAMEQSLTIPTATSFRTLAVALLEANRTALNASLARAERREKLSFTHIIAFAIVRAAIEQPAIVTSFRRDGATSTRVANGVHLGLAVDTERKDGSRFLVVPVIHDAGALEFSAFRTAYESAVTKARTGQLAADDLVGASLTLTNPGGIGTVASVPRLTSGQAVMIAAGAIAYPPGFAHADRAMLAAMGVEKIMTLTSTYDHRVIQGAQSGEFLRRIDELLGGADGFYDSIAASLGVIIAAPETTPSAQQAQQPQPEPAHGEVKFDATELELPAQSSGGTDASKNALLGAVAAGMSILSAYRRHGHLAAHLDPLGARPQGDPALDWRNYGLTPSVMSAIPASVLRTKVPGRTLADVVVSLRDIYSSTIAYEIEHIANIEQREWLCDYIETGRHFVKIAPEKARNVLGRLTKVETFERYLRRAYVGHKTFSIEGLEMMVPMLEEIMLLFREDGIETTVLGMAHRGRLSTIAHVVDRPYEEILAEFEAANIEVDEEGSVDVTGDVKYHHGSVGLYPTPYGSMHVILANNPSHLEAVDGVVEGRTRALQTEHSGRIASLDIGRAAPILIHGDAAFSAQGVVAEVLNLQALPGYQTGGTIHLISNNQVGFTTDPVDARSTRYASDLAKGFDVPIVHVNADDVDSCIAAVHLAVDFKLRFGHDVIIDLIGYRRFGHNETDEPAYTQPDMYDRIKVQPSVRDLYTQKLIAQGTITAGDADALLKAATARVTSAHEHVRSGGWEGHVGPLAPLDRDVDPAWAAPRSADALRAWSDAFVRVPAGFTMHPKLERQLERRRERFATQGEFDWGLAEELAFASLLAEGTPIRLTGQDTERGTFSHRHLVFHDAKTNATHAPIQHLEGSRASFEIYNSPLSEYACLGFEYGYAVGSPDALVLWEAQFGDFNNGAQIIIDQFIAAGFAKWGETSRLALLLPHGYEGAGPEHSSARIERFLQLSAEGNVQVANCSTAAQYHNLLRKQAHQPRALPLVIFTPKSLLRNRAASGTIAELQSGTFRPVIDDERAALDREAVERVLLCSGKIYYDLIGNERYASLRKTAIVRIELLSPLPNAEIVKILESYPNLETVVWVQEEPKNMGARAHVRRRLIDTLPSGLSQVAYIGRTWRASPSEGYGGAHAVEQERIVREALDES